MRKMFLLFLLTVVCASLAWAGSPQRQEKVDRDGHKFRIDGIQAWKSNPCLVRLQVKYFIDPAMVQPCFIGAYIPSKAAMADFELRPAGRRNGVPKGEQSFSEDINIELHYLGLNPYVSSGIEVVIYDAAGPRCSKFIAWGRQWSRFAVQDIKPVQVTPDFIDPAYSHPCYLSGFVFGPNGASNDFKNKPAGFNPNGVAKGQKNFADGIGFELFYKGARSFPSSSLEVLLYQPGQNLCAKSFPWGQTWKSQTKR
jgi:hypothetical protein